MVKKLSHLNKPYRQNRQGTALILTLGALVLVSLLVVAFLTRASLSRLNSFSSAGQARAEWLAQTSFQTILGDLRKEIVAGSKQDGDPAGALYTQNGISIYVPKSNRTAVPQHVGPSVNPNLLKISQATVPFWSGTNYLASVQAPVRSLSNNSTLTSSLNQHSIPTSRWNEHYLLGSALPSGWQSPDWVIMTRTGAVDTSSAAGTPSLAQLANADPANPNRAIGRYAYAIYNEGGLLDINVAGNLLPSSQNSQRGRLHQVDLSKLVDAAGTQLIADPATLLAWRSPVSGVNSSSVLGSGGLFDPLLTFLQTNTTAGSNGATDQRFATRQDLINYATANPGVVSLDALQYLTTFSRTLNAPSWTPTADAPAGGPYNYLTNSESTSVTTINRDFANIRFTNAGTIPAIYPSTQPRTVVVGEPMLKEKFPLYRLTWIGHNGPANGASANDIKRAFGLVYQSTGIWEYQSPDGNTRAVRIKTLNEVAASNPPREPDFFELLQAGILNGSLGLGESYDTTNLANISYINPIAFRDMADTRDMERSTSRQIMQIGVNLIDQVQPDNWPTTILFDWFNDPAMKVNCPQAYTQLSSSPPYIGPPFTTPASSSQANYLQSLYSGVVGVTDIPYIYSFFQTFYEHPNLGGVGANHGNYVGMFHFVEMWNPHQKTGTYTSGPTKFRVRVEAGTSTYETYFNNNYSQANAITCSNPFIYDGGTTNQATSGPQEIDFTTSATVDSTFRTPTILTTANSSGPTTWEVPGAPYLSGGVSVFLIPGGYNSVTTSLYGNNGTGGPTIYSFWPAFFSTSPLPTYRLDYQDESGNWSTYPYQLLPEVCYYLDNQTPDNAWYGAFCHGMYRPDPRGMRWGLSQSGGNWRFNILTPSSDNSVFGPPTANYYQKLPYSSDANPGSPGGLFTSQYLGTYYSNLVWAFNDYSSNQYNAAVANLGKLAFNQTGNITHYTDIDGFLRPGDSINGTSPDDLSTTNLSSPTPSTDPRPIILHRPFRTVGEMSYAFRDMPWKTLDISSANSPDAALLDLFTVNDSVLHAGSVDLNTAQTPVLQAILAGAMKTESSSTVFTQSEAKTLAQSLINITSSNTAGLGPLSNVSELATRCMPNINDSTPWIKTQREGTVRVLSEIGQTRVWNLLIDLVVQSGKYPSKPTDLNSFVVEGERHYWLHVAIDRTTGAIVDQSLEPVTE